MKRLKAQRFISFLTVLTFMVILSSSQINAQEMTEISGEVTMERTNQNTLTVNNAEGHILALQIFEGTNTNTSDTDFMDNAPVTAKSTADLTKGDGNVNAYVKFGAGNEYIYSKNSHEVETLMTNEGTRMTRFSGVFNFISGTGKYKGIQGAGTYEGRFTDENTITVEWNGEYTLDRDVAMEQE